MAKRNEYEVAIKLRKQGMSYSQIKGSIQVSKSTLSRWLKDMPLTASQINKLRKSDLKIERYRHTMQEKRRRKLMGYYDQEKQRLLPIGVRDIYIAGLFLYWGEGNKVSRHTICISNTDPSIIKFAIRWMTDALYIPKQKIRVLVHLYSDMDIGLGIRYWSEELGLGVNQFMKPYIKESTRTSISHKGYSHGTCSVMYHDTIRKQKILMALKVMSDNSNGLL